METPSQAVGTQFSLATMKVKHLYCQLFKINYEGWIYALHIIGFFLLTYDCMLPTIALTCKTWCLVVDVHFFAIIIYQKKSLLSDHWQISGCGRQGWLFKGVKCESKWCHDFIHRQQIRRGHQQISTVRENNSHKYHQISLKYWSSRCLPGGPFCIYQCFH